MSAEPHQHALCSPLSDPVEAALIDSLAHPGGNVTGFTRFSAELSGKRLELLKEAFPRTSAVAVLWNPELPGPSSATTASVLAVRLAHTRLIRVKMPEPR